MTEIIDNKEKDVWPIMDDPIKMTYIIPVGKKSPKNAKGL
jgi:hypothetical protein